MSSKVEHSTELSDSANKSKKISLSGLHLDDNYNSSSSKCADSGKHEAICSKTKHDSENSQHSTEPSLGSSCNI